MQKKPVKVKCIKGHVSWDFPSHTILFWALIIRITLFLPTMPTAQRYLHLIGNFVLRVSYTTEIDWIIYPSTYSLDYIFIYFIHFYCWRLSHLQQGWKLAHRFSKRITRFWLKNERMSNSLKKMSNSLIRSGRSPKVSDHERFAHIVQSVQRKWGIVSKSLTKKRKWVKMSNLLIFQ